MLTTLRYYNTRKRQFLFISLYPLSFWQGPDVRSRRPVFAVHGQNEGGLRSGRLSTKSTGSLKNASIFSKRCSPLRRTSSGQSPHRSSRPDGQASLRFLAPSSPKQTRFAGLCLGPRLARLRAEQSFSEAHVPGKNRLNLIPSSADDGTLRGSCTKSGV